MSSLDGLISAGKNFACSIYKAQPGSLVPNPISSVLKFAWDNLCYESPPGLPSPPTRPFNGGQCAGVVYQVKIRKIDVSTGNVVETPTFLAEGKLVGIKSNYNPNNGITTTVFEYGGGTPSPGFKVLDTSTVGVQHRYEYEFINRVDGQPDNCGNLPLQYPSSPPPPEGGYNSPPVAITYNDGTDFEVSFNLQPPAPDDLEKPPDICLTVSWGGVDVELCFPPDALPNFGGGNGDDIKNLTDLINNLRNDFDDFRNDFDNFNDDWDFNFDPPDFDTDPNINKDNKEPDKKGEEDGIEGLVGVKLVLTTFPSDAQFGSPTVYFAGWLTFKLQNGYIERTPINFESGYFPAPAGATGYAYTLVKGAEGEVTVYTKMPEEEG